MARRKAFIALGGASALGSATLGTDAFSSVSAERAVEVSVAGDGAAYLALEPAAGPNGQYAQTDDGELVLDLSETGAVSGDGVNPSAVTRIEELFVVGNQGTQAVGIWVEDDADQVTFTVDGSEAESEQNAILLEPGDRRAIGLLVDTTDASTEETLLDSMTIHAQAGVQRQTGNGVSDDTSIEPTRTVSTSSESVSVTVSVDLPSRADVDVYERYDAPLGPATLDVVTVNETTVTPLFSDFDAGGGILLFEGIGPGELSVTYTVDSSDAAEGTYTFEAATVDVGAATGTTDRTTVEIGGN